MFLMQTKKAKVLIEEQKGYFAQHPDEKLLQSGLGAEWKAVKADAALTSHQGEGRGGCCTQLKFLMQREMRRLNRDKSAVKASFGVTIFLNLLYSLIFLSVGRGTDLFSHFGGLIQLTISV